jgi:hypothetical protein
MRTFLFTLVLGASACAGRYSQVSVPTEYAFHDAHGEAAVVARYMQGESLDQLASDLALADRDQARDVVHHAMIDLQKRYFHDR